MRNNCGEAIQYIGVSHLAAVKSKSEGVGMKDERKAIQRLNSSSLIIQPSEFGSL
jgi:hypothetical protein